MKELKITLLPEQILMMLVWIHQTLGINLEKFYFLGMIAVYVFYRVLWQTGRLTYTIGK